jgi:phosphoribosylformylglycinamidine synthase
MSVFEIYVEKKSDFAQEASGVAADLRLALRIQNIKKVRIVNRYFAQGISADDFEKVKNTIFSEPPVDISYDKIPSFDDARFFALEFLPGQFDQRADSCAQCISLATGKERPLINSSKIYAVYGDISSGDFTRIKSYLINPVESKEATIEKPSSLDQNHNPPKEVENITGFINFSDSDLEETRGNMNLAMDLQDLRFCRSYFQEREKRDPSVAEIRLLDTYWSDHCRHTTFLTELENIQIDTGPVKTSFEKYTELRHSLGRSNLPITLMDVATIGAKALKKNGKLNSLDESEEINACSVKIKVDVDGKEQDWLLMFKNETHNHPTEIEPFGGAATCLGGAIRDPLSGRSFVYQAMRVTGAGDPLQSSTLAGKLPQRKICRAAAGGYSSYGNQIGLATGLVHEIYHSGYIAKRMEIGAVIGAAPAKNVIRKTPKAGDVVILLGGRTGRDGIGGATGSSKSHTSISLDTCGADVQKGNASEERKLQRLFRNPKAARLIKRCNDFGAGGVSVSVGELADGIEVNLSAVPKKYEGLDGTELAISESQERMSCVIAKKDIKEFIALAAEENIEATIIARVTREKRLVMKWNGKTIVNLSREFLNSNGAKKIADARVTSPVQDFTGLQEKNISDARALEIFAAGLNICSQKGLGSLFDSSIGAATVTFPFGGKYQLTPVQSMSAKIPVQDGDTKTCSLMSWGFDPFISSVSPYHGAVFAVVYSLAKIISSGGSRKRTWLTFQEYFERLRDDPLRWGKPFSSLLGALDAQIGLEIASIGGKDSMSGSFTAQNGENIDVPPTLVSFAVSVTKIDRIITPEFKKAGSFVYFFKAPVFKTFDFSAARGYFDTAEALFGNGKIISAWAVGPGGTAEAVLKMCFGNRIGFSCEKTLYSGGGFGGFVFETDEPSPVGELLGHTTAEYKLVTDTFEISLDKLQNSWENTLENVYPYLPQQSGKTENFLYDKTITIKPKERYAKPCFVIPVFPGTNSEYDTARAVAKAGGKARIVVIRDLTPAAVADSVRTFAKAINNAQGMVIPGGFSGADEPDGSGKFITAFIRNSAATEAVMELLQKRDGLVCGICNGFQALVKLGLVPYGEIREMTDNSPTLTFNTIGRHQSVLVATRVVSGISPWLSHLELGGTYFVPVSHGEGRFIADESTIQSLAANGQIATQYVDFEGNASHDIRFNPNNSNFAIEGITSADGRVFGRMAHNERFDDGLYKNIPGIKKMDIFTGAVNYFR